MYDSILHQYYAGQAEKENTTPNSPIQANSIRAIIDNRFDSLINRATTLAKSNQITAESHNDIFSPNKNSTESLSPISSQVNKKQILSPACKHRLQGSSSSSSGIISTSTRSSSCNTLQWNPIGITLFGNGSSGNSLNLLNGPSGVFVDGNDIIYVADSNNHRILKLSSGNNGTMNATVVAGITSISGVTSTTLNGPKGIYVDSQQNLYISDTLNYRVQFWSYGAQNGSTVAGSSTGVIGSTLDKLGYSYALYVDNAKNVYVSDESNGRVVKWSSGALTGIIVAGNGSQGYTSGQLSRPLGVTIDSQNKTLYIADFNLHTIVTWSFGMTSGTIVAGLNSTLGNTASLLYAPWGIALDTYGNLYVSDFGNHRIQMFCNNGSSFSSGTTIAGIGISQLSSRGLYGPTSLALDSQMNLYVADYINHRIQKFLRTN